MNLYRVEYKGREPVLVLAARYRVVAEWVVFHDEGGAIVGMYLAPDQVLQQDGEFAAPQG